MYLLFLHKYAILSQLTIFVFQEAIKLVINWQPEKPESNAEVNEGNGFILLFHFNSTYLDSIAIINNPGYSHFSPLRIESETHGILYSSSGYTYIHTCVHIHTCICIYECVCIDTHVCTYVYISFRVLFLLSHATH